MPVQKHATSSSHFYLHIQVLNNKFDDQLSAHKSLAHGFPLLFLPHTALIGPVLAGAENYWRCSSVVTPQPKSATRPASAELFQTLPRLPPQESPPQGCCQFKNSALSQGLSVCTLSRMLSYSTRLRSLLSPFCPANLTVRTAAKQHLLHSSLSILTLRSLRSSNLSVPN